MAEGPIREPSKDSPAGDAGKEELFDLVLPPGTPQSIISDIIQKFDVDLVERKEKLYFANMDGDERLLLAFRGKLSVMKELEPYFYRKMKEYIEK